MKKLKFTRENVVFWRPGGNKHKAAS